jgi:hypothetical protein
MRTHIGALNIHAEMYSENLLGRDHGEIGVHGQLKLILKLNMKLWNEFVWLQLGSSGKLF